MKVVKVYSMKQAFNDLKRCPYCRLVPSVKVQRFSKNDIPMFTISCGTAHKKGRIFVHEYSLKQAVQSYNALVDSKVENFG